MKLSQPMSKKAEDNYSYFFDLATLISDSKGMEAFMIELNKYNLLEEQKRILYRGAAKQSRKARGRYEVTYKVNDYTYVADFYSSGEFNAAIQSMENTNGTRIISISEITDETNRYINKKMEYI